MDTVDIENRDRLLGIADSLSIWARSITLCGLIAGAAIYAGTPGRTVFTQPGITSALIGFVVAVLLLSVAAQISVFFVLSAFLTGSQAVQWVRPRECSGLLSWVAYEWAFYSEGWQQGYRILGVEVATRGRLNYDDPL